MRKRSDKLKLLPFKLVKPVCLVLILSLLIASGSGCWSRVEIEKMSFISMIGVDRAGDGELLVSYQIVVPRSLARGPGGGGSTQEPPFYVVSVKAPTLADSLSKLAEESPRVVRLRQLNGIIFGEDLARSGLGPTLDFFGRHWEVRRSVWVLVAKGRAQDILTRGIPVQERLPGSAIKIFMERRPSLTSTSYPIVLGDFLTYLTRAGQEPIAASVELYPVRELEGREGGEKQGSDVGGKAAEGRIELAFKGAGVFLHDRLIQFLEPRETRGVLWVQGKVKGGVIDVPAGANNVWASLVTDRESTRVFPQLTKNGIRFKIEIRETGFI